MARYPAMVRRRIVELYEQDYSTAEIAEVFGVCESGVRRVRQRLRERGTLGNDFFTGDRLEGWQYPVAQLLTEFMIKQDKKRYVAFIDGIKDGMKWEESLTQKYGAPKDRLVAVFSDSLNVRGLSAAQATPDRRRPEAGKDQEQREREQER